MALPQADVPGPGTYNPNFASIEPDEHNNISKVGRDAKYTGDHIDGTGDDCTTGSEVGPGTYESHLPGTIGLDASKAIDRSKMSKSTQPLGFAATGTANEMPWESHHGVASAAEATPAPIAYDPLVTEKGMGLAVDAPFKETFNAKMKEGKGAFAVEEATRQSTADKLKGLEVVSGWGPNGQLTDPGSYNPNSGSIGQHTEIVNQAKATFQTSNQAGKGGFGGTEPRELKLANTPTHPPVKGYHSDIEDTPGPAAYNPQVTETGRESDMHRLHGVETMKSAVFASTTDRTKGMALPQADVPGPGTYNPNFASIEPDEHNNISKVGRDAKYTGDHIDGTGDDCTTGSEVGPGTYDPLVRIDGEKATIERKVLTKAEAGWDASFMSDSFRTMFTAIFPKKPAKLEEVRL